MRTRIEANENHPLKVQLLVDSREQSGASGRFACVAKVQPGSWKLTRKHEERSYGKRSQDIRDSTRGKVELPTPISCSHVFLDLFVRQLNCRRDVHEMPFENLYARVSFLFAR